MQKLPDYYVIKRDPSNPLWEKYIKSFDHIFISKYGWDQMYVGIDCDGSGYSNDLSDFKKPIELITLEQWDEAVNPFVLPERWCVKRTPENYKVINDWANKGYGSHKQFLNDGYIGSNFCRLYSSQREDYTEITFDQFKKYVLKENDMSKEELKDLPHKEWKKGDMIECLETWSGQFTKGKVYKVQELYSATVDIELDDSGSTTNGWVIDKFKFHSRPKSEPMKDRTITAQQAQSIIDIVSPGCQWKKTLAKLWGESIVLNHKIVVPEDLYKDLRKDANKEQHELGDSIFGKDKKEFTTAVELKIGQTLLVEKSNCSAAVGKHLTKVGNQSFFIDEQREAVSFSAIVTESTIGKKVKIKNIEFEEVND